MQSSGSQLPEMPIQGVHTAHFEEHLSKVIGLIYMGDLEGNRKGLIQIVTK